MSDELTAERRQACLIIVATLAALVVPMLWIATRVDHVDPAVLDPDTCTPGEIPAPGDPCTPRPDVKRAGQITRPPTG